MAFLATVLSAKKVSNQLTHLLSVCCFGQMPLTLLNYRSHG